MDAVSATPFTVGIPLIARAAAYDWAVVQHLFRLTLRSLSKQTDAHFRIVVAGHDRPDTDTEPACLDFIEADWPTEAVRSDNLDSGRKKALINAHVRSSGGGYLMFVDADDWVDTRTVATVRARLPPGPGGLIGGVVASGYAIDLRNRRALPIPHPDVFNGGFHELCGSSTVALVDPGAASAVRRDPHSVLHEHYRWEDACREHGVVSARLDLVGAYLVNTSANHSTSHGPFAEWRQRFDAEVAARGDAIDAALLARFGLDEGDVRDLAATLTPR